MGISHLLLDILQTVLDTVSLMTFVNSHPQPCIGSCPLGCLFYSIYILLATITSSHKLLVSTCHLLQHLFEGCLEITQVQMCIIGLFLALGLQSSQASLQHPILLHQLPYLALLPLTHLLGILLIQTDIHLYHLSQCLVLLLEPLASLGILTQHPLQPLQISLQLQDYLILLLYHLLSSFSHHVSLAPLSFQNHTP